MTLYRDIQVAQNRALSQRENEARQATSLHTMESTGVGETIEAEPLLFPNPFVYKPAIAYGSEVLVLPDQTLWALPRISGSVMEWELNDRGFYLGAYVYVTVDLDPAEGVTPVEQPTIRVEHNFMFSSLAFKALGPKVTDQLQGQDIPPKTVSL